MFSNGSLLQIPFQIHKCACVNSTRISSLSHTPSTGVHTCVSVGSDSGILQHDSGILQQIEPSANLVPKKKNLPLLLSHDFLLPLSPPPLSLSPASCPPLYGYLAGQKKNSENLAGIGIIFQLAPDGGLYIKSMSPDGAAHDSGILQQVRKALVWVP